MGYKYRTRRQIRKIARNSRRNFIITLVLIVLLAYGTVNWVLPSFINGIGFVKNNLSPPDKIIRQTSDSALLAPPVLNIPYEATNTAQIGITGYATANSKVKLYLDDQLKDTVDTLENGDFVVRNLELSLGTNNIYAKTLDEKNVESLPSKTIRVIYDDEKPSLILNEPEDNKQIQGGDKRVRFSGKSELGVQIFINDNQIIVDKDGNFTTDLPLNEGDNDFNVRAKDKASNSSEISRRVTYQP